MRPSPPDSVSTHASTPAGRADQDVWRQQAGQWHRVGAPLRPCVEDGRLMVEMAQSALDAAVQPASVVVLGVTPEVVQLPWPVSSRLTACDQSAAMIETVWRPHPQLSCAVRQARWQAMPLDDASVDVLAGDASLNALSCPAEYAEVLTELARVLRPTGLLVLRCFLRPARAESLDEVRATVQAGGVAGFHALKWRVAMALAGDAEFGVAVADIRSAFDRLFPDRERLSAQTGWPRAAIDTIDAYRGSDTRLNFPTMERLADVVAPWMQVVERRVPVGYELAERCPTISLRLRES